MRLGAILQPRSREPGFAELIEAMRHLESAGFDSLWAVQAVGRGFMLPDPLLTLAAASAATSRVHLGTAVLQLPLYAPAALAASIFSLMHLAGERLRIGLGAGSTEADFRVFERDYATRFQAFDDALPILKQLLATGAAAGVNLSPYPDLLGGPPLLLGSWGKGVTRAAREFSGWIASNLHRSTEEVLYAHARYRDAGGQYAVVSSIMLGPLEDANRDQDRLQAFAEAGFDEAVVLLRPDGAAPEVVRSWLP